MQFVIARNALQKELAFVQGIVERKNTIPVLANILIESAGEDSIRISGTDLDVTIRCDADAQEISTQGAICVPARKLFDIARLLPDAPVSFRKEENEWVTVECDRSKFRLPGVSKETFPELPGFKSTPMKLPASVLKMILRQGTLPSVGGIAGGVLASIAVGGLVQGIFPGTAADFLTFLLIVPVVVAVVMLAAYIPARRAARIDPLMALRQD